MAHEVLPDVPYVQLVFTIPKMLRRSFLFDRTLYGDLCRAAYEATRKFFEAHFPTLERAVPAMPPAPPPPRSLLTAHPPAHPPPALAAFPPPGNDHPPPADIDPSPPEDLLRAEVFKSVL
jgi:hypothetical protein